MKKISLLLIILAMITLSAWSINDQNIGTEDVPTISTSVTGISDVSPNLDSRFVYDTIEPQFMLVFINQGNTDNMMVKFGYLSFLANYIFYNSGLNNIPVYKNRQWYGKNIMYEQIGLV